MSKDRRKAPKPQPPRTIHHAYTPQHSAAQHTTASGHTISDSHEVSKDLPIAHETSAGGVIVKAEGGYAFVAVIARRNRAGNLEWCLPKGHLEGEETAAQAAVREVSEETGIYGRALKHLTTIDYWFSGHHHRIHKVVHHYLLEALSGSISVEGDPDHEAELAEWVRIDRVAARLAYPNERKIINMAAAVLRGSEQ